MFNLQNTNTIYQIIDYAIQAPSLYNCQPWSFEVRNNIVIISADFSRQLPVIDSQNRSLFISLGCATENFCIAANHFGYQTQVEMLEEKIVITLEQSAHQSVKIPLDIMLKRQTNRKVYDKKSINPELLNQCIADIGLQDDINIYTWQNGTNEFSKISEYIYQGNSLLINNQDLVEEFKDWLRASKQQVAFTMMA